MANIQIVGVINITPDSFNRKHSDVSAALKAAEEMYALGVAFVDVGAESTNPWSSPISHQQEWRRLEPVLSALTNSHPSQISVDTYHAETAAKALALNNHVIINDVTGLSDPKMASVIARFNARCIIGHVPKPTIQEAHKQADFESVEDLVAFHKSQTKKLVELGVDPKNIWWDPCIGFGKKPLFNVALLAYAAHVPNNQTVMIGYSGKRVLGIDWQTGEPLENAREIQASAKRNLEAAKIVIGSAQPNQTVYLRVHDNLVSDHLALLSS